MTSMKQVWNEKAAELKVKLEIEWIKTGKTNAHRVEQCAKMKEAAKNCS